MPVEELLDFGRRNVLSASDDQFLQATDYFAITVLIDRPEISGMHPAIGINRFSRFQRVFPISEHDRVAANADLTDLSPWNNFRMLVDNLDFDVRHHPANCGNPPFYR